MTLPTSPTVGAVTVPGARLHYEIRGGSGPLVLVIGSPMASAEFAPLADALAGDRTVVTYDPRGYANSPVDDPDAQSAVEQRADDVKAILDDLCAEPADVITSAQAAARVVAGKVPAGAAVLVVGGEGLLEAVREHGLRPVRSLDDDPAAVVQGYDATVGWQQLAEASYAVAKGLPWVASNTDLTIPTARGTAPGNGTLVAAVRTATGVDPEVAGKPLPPMHRFPLLPDPLRRVLGGDARRHVHLAPRQLEARSDSVAGERRTLRDHACLSYGTARDPRRT